MNNSVNKKIICLTDYKGHFGSKWGDVPYRSGMDKELLTKYFSENGFKAYFKKFSIVDFNRSDLNENIYLYTSSEDIGYQYKSFIEDVILGIQERGGRVIPDYKFLRANNNKVFMEILRKSLKLPGSKVVESSCFGTLEELLESYETLNYPVVFKLAEGAMGANVELAKNKDELKVIVGKYCRSKNIKEDIRDFGRAIKRKGYRKESLFRKKFIIQNFIPNLKNDWKVYVFYNKYFIFYRPVFKHRTFKASGGGYDNYFYGKNAHIVEGIFEFAENVFNSLDVPHASLDIGFDGNSFYLFEFQCIYFGNAGVVYSDEYFIKKNNTWVDKKNDKNIEKVYVESIVKYLEHN